MRNNRGFTEVAVLIYVIAGLTLLFVPNPISSAVGVGIRPNKTIQTEKIELIKDSKGNPIAYKTTTSNKDIQQRVGFFEWLRSLPILVILLMGSGVIFPPISLFLNNLYRGIETDTKKIVVGVDKALSRVKDDELKKQMLLEMGNV